MHTTDALVLKSVAAGEADRSLWLLSGEFGLISARAKSVREEHSKLRYALQDYMHTQVSLVRGKRGWRITGACARDAPILSGERLAAYARIAALMCRLAPMDDTQDALYEILAHTRIALCDTHEIRLVELVCVARMLFVLGYLSHATHYAPLLEGCAYDAATLATVRACAQQLTDAVNQGIIESQL